jgi:hypothetical protein
MSTKTIYKRIALVAVATLGAGVLSVAPANAAFSALEDEVAILTAIAPSSTTPVAVGSATAVTVPVSVGAPAALTATKGFTVTTAIVSKPAGSTNPTIAASIANASTSVFVASGTTTATKSQIELDGAIFETLANATNGGTLGTAASGGSRIGDLTLTGFDKPGIYTFSVTPNGAATDVAATVTVIAGYSADLVNANKAFPTQGSNITTGWTATAGGQATVRFTGFASDSVYYVTTDNGSIISGTEGDNASIIGAVTNTNGTNLAGGFNFTTGTMTGAAASNYMDVKVTDLDAASTTVTLKTFNASTGASTTFAAATVTWGAAPVISASNSTSIIDTTTASAFSNPAADLAVSVDGTVATTRVATVKVILKDSANTAVASKTLTAVITGPGLIQGKVGTGSANAYTDGSASGSRVATVDTDGLGQGFFAVFADGSGGVGTITISQGTTVISTETVTFSGIATQLKNANLDADKASLNSVYIGVKETGILKVSSADVNGNKVSSSPTGLVVTSDSTTVATVSITGGTGDITVTGVAVGKANITISVGALATATIKLVVPVEITKVTAKTVSMAWDKATYAPGEKMILTVKALDSNGAGVADGARVLFSDTATANVLLGTLPTGTVTLKGGIKEYTYYAPFAAGDITVTAKEGAAVDAVIASTTAAPYTAATITATASVVNAGVDAATDAAAEATDAANAATDAALAAADAADAATAAAEDASAAVAKLSKSVTTALNNLKKQITSLTALVNKLLKR